MNNYDPNYKEKSEIEEGYPFDYAEIYSSVPEERYKEDNSFEEWYQDWCKRHGITPRELPLD